MYKSTKKCQTKTIITIQLFCLRSNLILTNLEHNLISFTALQSYFFNGNSTGVTFIKFRQFARYIYKITNALISHHTSTTTPSVVGFPAPKTIHPHHMVIVLVRTVIPPPISHTPTTHLRLVDAQRAAPYTFFRNRHAQHFQNPPTTRRFPASFRLENKGNASEPKHFINKFPAS